MTDVDAQPETQPEFVACPDCSTTHMLACFRCGETAMNHREPGIVECKSCSAREAFGEPMPRIVVQPHTDRRFIVVTVDDGAQIVIDQRLARMLANALISVA